MKTLPMPPAPTPGASPRLRRRGRPLALLLALGLVAAPLLASAPAVALTETLTPGQAFEVFFDFGGGAPDPGVDVLIFALDPVQTTATGVLGYQVELRNGGSLLGTTSSTGLQPWAFKESGSVYDDDFGGGTPPVVVDFGAIASGSFDGSLRLIPQFDPGVPGASLVVGFNPPPGTGLQLGTANSADFFTPSSTGPTYLRSQVPEPGLALLLPLALLAGAALGPRRAS